MMKKTVTIKTEFIKLDSLLKYAGITETGGDAKFFIQNGEVSVNGETCLQRGKKIYPGDTVSYGSFTLDVGSE